MLSASYWAHMWRALGCAVLIIISPFIANEAVYSRQTTSQTVQLKEAARYLKEGEFDKAEQLLQTLSKTKALPEAFEMLGLLRVKQQRLKEAESFFQSAIRLNPRLANAYVNLGYLYKQTNQPELSLRNFQTAATLLSNNSEPLFNIALLLADSRQFDKAIQVLEAIRINARPDDYWDLLSRLYLSAGNFPKAEDSLRKVLARKPDSISTLRQLSGVALKLNEPQRAWQYLGDAVRLAPNSPDLLYEFAQLSLRNNLGQEAVIATRKALFLEPDRHDFLLFLGNALLNTASFHDALTYLNQYVRLKPDDASGQLSLGWALYLEKDFDGARKHLEECLRLSPDLIDAYYHLGMIAYETGDRTHARDFFTKVVDRKSDHASALLGLGMIYSSEQQYERARLSFEASARANGDEPKVHYQLAQVYSRLGNQDAARREQGLYAGAQKRVEERKKLSQSLPFSAAAIDRSKPNQH